MLLPISAMLMLLTLRKSSKSYWIMDRAVILIETFFCLRNRCDIGCGWGDNKIAVEKERLMKEICSKGPISFLGRRILIVSRVLTSEISLRTNLVG